MLKYFIAPIFFLCVFFSCSDRKPVETKPVNSEFQKKAISLLEKGQLDSSFYYFDKAKEQFILVGDSVNVARCLIDMAINQYEWSDFFGAQETSLEALKYLDVKSKKSNELLASVYNTIANATDDMGQFEQAISYYNLAIQYSTNPENKLLYRNNLAISLRNSMRYRESIELLEVLVSETNVGSVNYAKFLSNLAKVKSLMSKTYNPLPLYNEALRIREQKKDLWGQNSSYSTLYTYYQDVAFDSAIYYAEKHYEIATKINSPNDRLKALRGLIQSGPAYATTYLPTYLALNDSIQNARTKAKNQFALIRYESEKSKLRNLVLEQDNEKKEARLFKQTIGIIALILVLVAVLLFFKKRKQRMALEAANKLKETQLHLSKKIHDVVANGIYRVMTEIEYKGAFDKEDLLDKLDGMYQKSRDISHDVEEQSSSDLLYSEHLADLLKSFAGDYRRVLIVGNGDEQWDGFNKREQGELLHVLQELMVNMDKHSQAEQVIIRFSKHDGLREIVYQDNGVGMPEKKKSGKGLHSTVSRIKSIGGEIIFVSEERKGLRVTITIPL
ncbi:tetratricopeptide repeat-containing sensor histidine kinase [Sphingobacterium sp. MYb382]|uniref:tetratricopeptide repeat-containing sensor histidine kinase n=1 Tax=Sphingobacterium sp. MYb382 TaxID=2745278 RepID=UPI0030A88237